MTASSRVAVIDLGTNAVRMQIVGLLPGRRHELVAEEREVVRLGEGLFATGQLSPEAMRRTRAAIGRFARLARRARVHALRAVATAAVREARNRAQFVRDVARETGVALEVISGAEEARLTCVGVLRERSLRRGDHVICDLGGGSTELTHVRRGEPRASWSLELGSVRLTELFLSGGDPPGRRELERLRLYVRQALRKLPRRGLPRDVGLVGSSGTIGAIAEILHVRSGRPGRPRVDRDELRELLAEAAAMSLAERRRIPGIDERRAEILVAGCALLLEVMDHLGARRLLPTRRGLRDGLVADLLARASPPGPSSRRRPDRVLDEGVRAFLRRCGGDELHADRVAAHALAIFDAVARPARLDPAARELLRGAAMLHDVGKFVAYARHHRHSYYLIANAELPGWSDHERELVANVARYHRKSMPSKRHPPFQELPEAERAEVRKLAAILRLADSLDLGRGSALEDVELRRGARELRLRARHRGEAELERWAIEEKVAPVFQEVFGLRLRLEL